MEEKYQHKNPTIAKANPPRQYFPILFIIQSLQSNKQHSSYDKSNSTLHISYFKNRQINLFYRHIGIIYAKKTWKSRKHFYL